MNTHMKIIDVHFVLSKFFSRNALRAATKKKLSNFQHFQEFLAMLTKNYRGDRHRLNCSNF
jgi:hypothetical protein